MRKNLLYKNIKKKLLQIILLELLSKGWLFKYLVVVNEIEVAGIQIRGSTRSGVRCRTEVYRDGGKAFPPSGGEQEASSELPLHSILSLSLSLSLFPFSLYLSFCLCLVFILSRFSLSARNPNPLISVSQRSREMVPPWRKRERTFSLLTFLHLFLMSRVVSLSSCYKYIYCD